MSVPRWDDETLKAGTMVRTALWLVTVVGEGNVFTKEEHRNAFPGISQADRRMRDLRDYDWVIHTNTEDATLRPQEQRFVKAGVPVWQRDVKRAATSPAITAKQRQAVFAADDYQCVTCGIAGGETYADSPSETAVLAASSRTVRLSHDRTELMYVTECKRCRSGTGNDQSADLARLLSDIRDLDEAEQRRLLLWIKRGRRGATPIDRAWTAYRRLPSEARDTLLGHLDDGTL
uniref:hypothetical protein n=1 Tax=Herbidospora sakaeratensis TaxID=564415 RepID=UPI000783A67A|nr:hypothetical protein [Herbidospora sakaeratensis]